MTRPLLALYYLPPPEKDRWFPGDRYLRKVIRRIVRGKPRPGGVDMVFINLCKGLDQLGVAYDINPSFSQLDPEQIVCIFGRGSSCLAGYQQSNPIIAGIGLMTHPAEWPGLCTQYPVKRYLQHSEWSNNLYIPYYGDEICQDLWPVGIDTNYWDGVQWKKQADFLIYNKIHWDQAKYDQELITPIKETLLQRGLTFTELEYGKYSRNEYKELLSKTRAMIFLAEHESQGLAYQEALSMNVPVLAWDPGKIMDPQYAKWGDLGKPATSVPYWDERCGITFKEVGEFSNVIDRFWQVVLNKGFAPREYILDNLTLEKCAQLFMEIVQQVQREQKPG